jgi:hypothetical protein
MSVFRLKTFVALSPPREVSLVSAAIQKEARNGYNGG